MLLNNQSYFDLSDVPKGHILGYSYKSYRFFNYTAYLINIKRQFDMSGIIRSPTLTPDLAVTTPMESILVTSS